MTGYKNSDIMNTISQMYRLHGITKTYQTQKNFRKLQEKTV